MSHAWKKEEIKKIGVVRDSDGTVKISVSEYRDLVEAVATLKAMGQVEHDSWWEERLRNIDLEAQVEEYKEFLKTAYDIRERFYEFKKDKERAEEAAEKADKS